MHKIKTMIILLGSCLILTSGCRHTMSQRPLSDYAYTDTGRPIQQVGRIALIELCCDPTLTQIASDMTDALLEAMQKKRVFGLTVVRQDSPTLQSLHLDHNGTYTLEQLSALRKTLQCDAVLTGDITAFKPYPHMDLGLRLRLIDLTDGQLVWAMEYVWDTTDKTTKDRINEYYSDQTLLDFSSTKERLGTVSQLKFMKFVAYEISRTLHPRPRVDSRNSELSTYNF